MIDVPKFKIDHTTIQPGKNHKVRVELLWNCQTENCWRGLFWSEFQFGRKIRQKAFRFLCWVFCSGARSTHYHHFSMSRGQRNDQGGSKKHECSLEWFKLCSARSRKLERRYALKRNIPPELICKFRVSHPARSRRGNQPSPVIHCPHFIIQWLSELRFLDYFLDGSSECFMWF